MRIIAILLLATTLFSCQEEVKKDYVSIAGTIQNKNSDSITISSKGYSKIILVKKDGSFSDTLKVSPGIYRFYDGGEVTQLYLKNGYDLQMSLDTEEFDESIAYTGTGADHNNFLAKKALTIEKLLDFEIDGMDQAALNNKLSEVESAVFNMIENTPELDTLVVNASKKDILATVKSYNNYFGNLIALRENLPEGTTSPTFEDYENHAGGTTSLADLKGKFVYVDVWATWCGPCKAEIPHLKEVEKDYHDKNIEFVSISIDREKDHQKWVEMVKDKELGGIQLFADNNWESKFVKDYYIKGIPRFILIDPQGKVVTPDAPRPSNPKLRVMLDEKI